MDYYQTLGVSKNSSPDEIKKAYRKLASQHHPDKGGDTAMFQKIEEAYRILSDPQKRQEYDNPRPQFNQGQSPFGFHFSTDNFDFNDLFGQMFRQNFNQHQSQPRQQVFRTSVNITLEQSYFGGEHHMQLQLPNMNKMVRIEIPKGVHNGGQVKINDVIEGAALVVEFRVAKHLKYDRSGNDLISTHPVNVLDLIAGGSFEFVTISGSIFEVQIKPKTQPYMQLKISGKGMPIFGSNNHYGDQIILLKPFIPDIIDQSIIDSIVKAKNK